MWCSVHSFDQQNLPTEMTSKRRNFQKLNQIKRTSHAEKSDVLRDKNEGESSRTRT